MRGRQKSRRDTKGTRSTGPQPAARPATTEVVQEQRPTAETIRQAQVAPETLSAAELLQLQRAVGNRALSRALSHQIGRRPPSAASTISQTVVEADQTSMHGTRADVVVPEREDGGRQSAAHQQPVHSVPSLSPGSRLVQRGLWSRIRQAATTVGGGIANRIKRAVAGAKTAWNSAKGLARRVGHGVKSVAQRALGAARKVWAGAKESAGNLLTRVTQVAKGAWNAAKIIAGRFWGGAPGFMDKVEARARKVWVKGKAMVAKIWNRTKSTSSKLQNGVKVLWNRAIQGARNLWGRARQRATSFWGRVRSFWRSAASRARAFWNNVKNRVTSLWSRARQVADRLRQRVRQLWSRAKQLAQRVWSRVAQGARAAWQGVGWFGRQLWSKLKGIYHRVINWRRLLPTRLKRLIDHLWDGVKSMKPWALSWWQSLGKASTWKGFAQWLGTSLIQLLEVVGVGEIYETVADFVKFNTRELTGAEKAKARLIFGGAVDYNLVRVDDRALLGPAFTRREYVSFHIINGWGGIRDDTLIHEMTHVWQYANMGAIYMPRAIGAQASVEGYDYGGVPGLRRRQAAGQGLTSFNLEQQASIIQDYYTAKYENRIGRQPVPAANQATILATYEHFAREARA